MPGPLKPALSLSKGTELKRTGLPPRVLPGAGTQGALRGHCAADLTLWRRCRRQEGFRAGPSGGSGLLACRLLPFVKR